MVPGQCQRLQPRRPFGSGWRADIKLPRETGSRQCTHYRQRGSASLCSCLAPDGGRVGTEATRGVAAAERARSRSAFCPSVDHPAAVPLARRKRPGRATAHFRSSAQDPPVSFGPILDAALAAQAAYESIGSRGCVIGGVALQRWGEPRFARAAASPHRRCRTLRGTVARGPRPLAGGCRYRHRPCRSAVRSQSGGALEPVAPRAGSSSTNVLRRGSDRNESVRGQR